MVEGRGEIQSLAVPNRRPVLVMTVLVANPGIEHQVAGKNAGGRVNTGGQVGAPVGRRRLQQFNQSEYGGYRVLARPVTVPAINTAFSN